ncbi:MAG: SDR family oxidoreductase [Thermoplasmata archaeon]|nr:SDR family oxidoreductase [Thermoplasmata archaeon]
MTGMMSGKICLITGATSGIGRETALALGKMGATVVFTARSAEKGKATRGQITAVSKNEMIDSLECDLSSLSSVHDCCANFRERYDRLHILINNAGTWERERKVSKDGIENTFAVNHLAPFLMTNLLLDLMERSSPARIISVSSGLHGGTINFDDVEFKTKFNAMKAYRQSKLANILFIKELSRRLTGTGVTANCLMPGLVATGLSRNAGAFGRTFFRVFGASPEKGADTSVYLASSQNVMNISGECFRKRRVTKTSKESNDPELARRLWELSENHTQRWFPLDRRHSPILESPSA